MRTPATMPHRGLSLVPLLFALGIFACGKAGPTGPSETERLKETTGSITVGAHDIAAVVVELKSQGGINASVSWGPNAHDIDLILIRGRCTREEILGGALPQCGNEAQTVGEASTDRHPETVQAGGLQPGPYTLILLNRGFTGTNQQPSLAQTCTYLISTW